MNSISYFKQEKNIVQKVILVLIIALKMKLFRQVKTMRFEWACIDTIM